MTDKRVFLLDAYALIYRAYFAFINNHRYSSKGVNTSAMIGFTNTLEELIEKEKPTHIGVAFDKHAPTFRHEIFKEYKANRDAMPEEMRVAIPYIREIILAYNIPIIELEGFEADDIVGTLSKQLPLEDGNVEVFMVTPDKDYAQLVTDKVFQYKPRRGDKPVEILKIEDVNRNFGVDTPLQVIDLLGLMGDSSDNIPGCPGVGPKTAQKLIAKYGSVENIYNNVDELKGKQKEKFVDNKEQVLLSKMLATIILDVPITTTLKDLKLTPPNVEKLRELFTELELRRNLNKLPAQGSTSQGSTSQDSTSQSSMSQESNPKASAPSTPSAPRAPHINDEFGFEPGTLFGAPIDNTVTTKSNKSEITNSHSQDTTNPYEVTNNQTLDKRESIGSYQHRYIVVDNISEVINIVEKLSTATEICFDTETTSLIPTQAELVGIALSVEAGEAYYIPVPAKRKEALEIIAPLKELLESDTIAKVGQNLKYDIIVLGNYDITVRGEMFDTMIAHYLIEPELRHNLDAMSEQYLNYTKITTESIIGKKGKKQLSMRDIPIEQVAEYAGEDVDCTLRLKKILEKDIEEAGVAKLFREIEMPLMEVLATVEQNGVTLDLWALELFSAELTQSIATLEGEIIEMAGEPFNVASPKQLGTILFDKLELNAKAKKTKTGQYSTGEDVLQKLINKHPIIEKILDYRAQKKLLSTYVDALPLLINSRTGRVHTNFNQTVVATGRLSSTNPNLQNIPIRREMGREIRRSFIASDANHIFLSADYSQVELRLMAAMSGDKAMIEAFQNNIDIHATTASKVFETPLEEVTSEMRSRAKSVNFGIIYGISAHGLAQNIGVKRREAQEIIDGYFNNFPDVKTFMDKSIEIAREKGYVETIFGRKRYLNDIDSANALTRGFAERNAINAPIQGSAADIIKIAMVKIAKRLSEENLKTKMILQVHDELNFDVPKKELKKVQQIVKEEMEGAIELSVPLTVDMGEGTNWLEAH